MWETSGEGRVFQTMDKKMIAALIACIAGFAVFISLAIFVATNNGIKKNGAVSNGKRVKYSAVSYSDSAGANGGSNHSAGSAQATKAPPASDSEFVRVVDYAPNIRVNLRYAGKNNFTGKKIYDFEDAYLRYGTVKKLIAAQEKLEKYGMGLEIWDAFRPVEAQFKLWEICPNPLYVSDPNTGYSSHARGNAVDVTLVDSDGIEMLMPTGFDNFTKLADRDYSDVDDEFAKDNVKLLEKAMKESGFTLYSEEWWHFTDTDEYDVDENFIPAD